MMPVRSSLLYMSSRPRAASLTSRSSKQIRSFSLHLRTIWMKIDKSSIVTKMTSRNMWKVSIAVQYTTLFFACHINNANF